MKALGLRAMCLLCIANSVSFPGVAVGQDQSQSPSDDPYAQHVISQGPQTANEWIPEPVVLDGPYVLQLRVIAGKSGEVIPHFRVRIESRTQLPFYPIEGPLSDLEFGRAFNGVSGSVTIDRLPQDRWRLEIESPPYIRHIQVVTTPYEGVLEIPMQTREATVKGRARDGITKEPLSGVNVKAREFVEVDGTTMWESPVAPTVTDAKGTFLLGPIAGSGYGTRISLDRTGYFPGFIDIRPDASLREELDDVYLFPQASLAGRLTAPDGNPLRHHFIYVVHSSIPYSDAKAVGRELSRGKMPSTYVKRYTTDEQGRFASLPLKGGRYTLVFGDLKNNIKSIKIRYGETKTVDLIKK